MHDVKGSYSCIEIQLRGWNVALGENLPLAAKQETQSTSWG